MVTQMRTDSVHCRESTSTGLIDFKVVPVTSAAFSSITTAQLSCASVSPQPLWVCSGHVNVNVLYWTDVSEA